MRRDLWKISGHANFYSENMFKPMELDDAEYQLKPMNCPGHILIYATSCTAIAICRCGWASWARCIATSGRA